MSAEETSTRLDVSEQRGDNEEYEEGKVESFLPQAKLFRVEEQPQEGNDDCRSAYDYEDNIPRVEIPQEPDTPVSLLHGPVETQGPCRTHLASVGSPLAEIEVGEYIVGHEWDEK